MSAVTGLDCWDVLLTAASACCIQLLHDAGDGVYIAVGYTLHGFHELERMLLSLLTGMISCHETDKPQPDTVHLPADDPPSSSSTEPAGSAAVSSSSLPQLSLTLESGGSKSDDVSAGTEGGSLAVDVEPQLRVSSHQSASHSEDLGSELQSKTSLQVAAHCKPLDTDMQLQTSLQDVPKDSAENKTETVITRSGRLVKSKNFADFTSSDVTVRDSAPAEKTSVKQRRGQPRKSRTSNARGTQLLNDTGKTDIINEEHDAAVASSAQQQVNEQHSHETDASNMITEHGTVIFFLKFNYRVLVYFPASSAIWFQSCSP